MKAPCPSPDFAVIVRKAKLARRRSRLAWPDTPFLGVKENVRFEACVAIRETLAQHWHAYRTSPGPKDRARIRSYVRAKITALRILRKCA